MWFDISMNDSVLMEVGYDSYHLLDYSFTFGLGEIGTFFMDEIEEGALLD